ncbi:MAG: hypothetical protein K2W94_05720 [Alphaproteobacteria bacterium]|nr:hypothetical protein [Alphaproteobacteria bacterium]
MRFLFFLILFCLTSIPTFSAAIDDFIDLESRIKGWYTEYKVSAPPSTKELRHPATFVGDLHRHLLEQETEDGVELYSRAILAVVGRGAGVGGLKLPRNDEDRSHLLTKQERTIVKSALIDAERLRRRDLDVAVDYFGTPDAYFARANDEAKRYTLIKHAKAVQDIAFQVHSLKDCIEAPEKAEDERMRLHLLKALTHLNLAKLKSPKIYTTRHSKRTLSRFDVFNLALHDQSTAVEILSKWGPYRDVPLAYFLAQESDDYSPEIKGILLKEMSALEENKQSSRPKSLVEQLLIESDAQTPEKIFNILSRKEIAAVRSTMLLEIFLNQYLPETGGAIIDKNMLLHLFKIAGKEIDNDPRRTGICLRALERFMAAYPNCPLSAIVDSLVTGISYTSNDQMIAFYLEGIRTVYRAASERYHATEKGKILDSIRPVFAAIYAFKGYQDLINTILTDLLRMDCLEMIDIGKFAGKTWVSADNAQALVGKFSVSVQGITSPDALSALMKNAYIDSSCKLCIADRLAALGAFDKLAQSFRDGGDLVNRRILELFRAHDRLSPHLLATVAYFIKDHSVIDFLFTLVDKVAWTEEERADLARSIGTNGSLDGLSGEAKKAEKFTSLIPLIARADLLVNLMENRKLSVGLKQIITRRLAELGHWNQLPDLLPSNSHNKIIFQEILKLLQVGGQLTPQRLDFAAHVASPEIAEDLLKNPPEIAFTPEQLATFSQIIRDTHKVAK